MCVIDIHTHAFPDAIAERAIAALTEGAGVQSYLDGRVSSLLRSMDESGIEISVLCSTATKPEQFAPILKWSRALASDRIIPFPSVYPKDPEALERLRIVRDEGFIGIKLHPYYQNFVVDDDELDGYYAEADRLGLIVLIHGGFDPAFPRDRIGSANRFLRLYRKFPTLKFIAAHLGAWDDWDLVREHLVGQPIYMDTAMAIDMMPKADAEFILANHPADYLLFGSDSPWGDPRHPLEVLDSLDLAPELKARIRSGNARRLLGLS
jgi:predicted TIM-barrel fold metal-dependent hydrolase